MQKQKKPTMQQEEKGFYIILALCLLAVVVSGYVLFLSPSAKAPAGTSDALPAYDSGTYVPSSYDYDQSVDIPSWDDLSEEETEAILRANGTPEFVDGAEMGAATFEEEEDAAPAAAESPIWVRPVSGAVIFPFSSEQLVFQTTFGDWRTHLGCDYAAKESEQVHAMRDGTVTAIAQDELRGTCVTVSHPDDLTSIYVGLSEKVKVKEGDTVKAGDLLGTVGTGNVAESAEESHLHLEVMQNGLLVDPEVYLGESTAQETMAVVDDVPTGIDVEE